jgi:hypothetical protein
MNYFDHDLLNRPPARIKRPIKATKNQTIPLVDVVITNP